MQKRRTVLTTIGTVGTVAIAGCSGEEPDFEEGNTGDSSDAPTGEFTDITPKNTTVEIGEEFEIGAELTNNGEETNVFNVEFRIEDETVESGNYDREPGESEYIYISINTGVLGNDLGPGEYEHKFISENDVITTDITYTEPEETGEAVFEITDTDSGASFLSTEEITLGGVVENTGDATGTQTVELIDGQGNTIDSEVELEPGETYDAVATWGANALEPGDYTFELVTEDDSETFTVTVEQGGPSEEDIELVDHELVVDEGEFTTDVTVEGTVSNNADTIASYVEVTVRIFDSSGSQLETYFDNISDLAADTDWEFEVMILESPDEFDDYDIAVEDVRF